MAKRRTSGIQRRERASQEALTRRLDQRSGPALPDWRLLAIGGVLVVGVVIVILVLILGSGSNPDAGAIQPNDGQTHVSQGADCRHPANANVQAECGGANPYSSLPATSGPHWPPKSTRTTSSCSARCEEEVGPPTSPATSTSWSRPPSATRTR